VARYLDLRDPGVREAALDTVVSGLRRGRVAVAPSESFYSLVTDAFSERGVTRIRELKADSSLPMGVIIGAPETLDGIGIGIPPVARDLISALWPGMLTLLVRQQPSLAWGLTSDTLAVRMPAHPVLLGLAARLGPTALTLANEKGVSPSQTLDGVDTDGTDFILDTGPLTTDWRSTVVDVTGHVPRLIREGAVSRGELAAINSAFEEEASESGE